jgi:hypothetical protein
MECGESYSGGDLNILHEKEPKEWKKEVVYL